MDESIAAALCALLAWAAACDVRRRVIPNWVSMALAALFILTAMVEPGRFDPAGALAAGAVTFTVLFAAYLGGLLGGGDVKLMTAAALWAGLSGLPALLLGTALFGGLLAAAVLVRRGLRRLRAGGRNTTAGRDGLPYGVAIAAAALLSNPLLFPG
ncbi:A24 family peptidase [Azospirillum picis]|uniref:Prepilin peptidase CpaA n=1 Tax=Azospirillum picis TaxID=488438 RepID=A0ABU0MN74_9PROT|nr:prepilin peptidase [Azospirillum picis]MBP2301115.1 prepilin peptidase CpaA [Azospirillum picis]MDQ0534923.1 prepilin peptidase CpaA [Azospirillum picis]